MSGDFKENRCREGKTGCDFGDADRRTAAGLERNGRHLRQLEDSGLRISFKELPASCRPGNARRRPGMFGK